jgi:DNA-binding Lrp family transcriptional regulator
VEDDRSPFSFDELDRRLVLALQSDPRLSYAKLGQRFGVTGMTVANRLQRLRDADTLVFRAAPNLEECGLGTWILGLTKTEVTRLGAVEACVIASPYVLTAQRITGEFRFII